MSKFIKLLYSTHHFAREFRQIDEKKKNLNPKFKNKKKTYLVVGFEPPINGLQKSGIFPIVPR